MLFQIHGQRPKTQNDSDGEIRVVGGCKRPKNDPLSNITDLTTSIKKNGVRVPLLVKPINGTYKVFSGQRRFEARYDQS